MRIVSLDLSVRPGHPPRLDDPGAAYTSIRSTSSWSASGYSRTVAARGTRGAGRRDGAVLHRGDRQRNRSSCCATATRCAGSTTSVCIAPARSRTAAASDRRCSASTTAGPTTSTASCCARRRWKGRRATFMPNDMHLLPDQVATWGPLVFANLDRKAPPLDRRPRGHPARVAARFDCERCAT